MTSTPFTSSMRSADDHPDIEEISALTEDLLTPDRTTALRRHLSGCELCADVQASLEEIRDTLGTLPGPARMPSDVASRIDAALAAEALLDSSSSDASAVSRETGSATEGSEHLSKDSLETAAPRHAAAVSRETADSRPGTHGRAPDRPAGHPRGSSRPGRHRPSRRTRRWRSAVLAGAGAVVALSIGGLVMQSLNSSAPPTAADQGERTTADGKLEKRVHSLLAEKNGAGESKGARTPDLKTKESPGNNPLAGGATSIPSCIRSGIDRTETPLAIDEKAPYKDGTGFLVVLPHRDDPQRVDAYVVDRSCISGDSTGPGKVLTTHTYARR